MDRRIDVHNKNFIPLNDIVNYKPSPAPLRASLYSKPNHPDDHHYEDPLRLAEQIRSQNSGPRRKQNEVYEPSGHLPTKKDTKSPKTNRSTKCNHIMLFLIMIIAAATLILVLLLMLGKVGENCACGNQDAAEVRQTSTQNSRANEELANSLQILKSELASLEKELEKQDEELQRVLQRKTQVREQFTATKEQLQQKDAQFLETVNKIELMIGDKKKELLSKLNSTAVYLNERRAKLHVSLTSLNLTMQQKEKLVEQKIQSSNDTLNSILELMNEVNSRLTKRDQELTASIAATNASFDSLNSTTKQTVQVKSNEVWRALQEVNLTLSTRDAQLRNAAMDASTKFGIANETLHNELSSSQASLQAVDSSINNDVTDVNSTLTAKVNVVSKKEGPRGANGSVGITGPQGDPGIQGVVNLTCNHKVKSSQGSGKLTTALLPNDPKYADKRITGVTCSVNLNSETFYTKLEYKTIGGFYDCICNPTNAGSVTTYKCETHFWICPIL